MAKRTAPEPKRSAFLRDFLEKNPKANLQATNEAWTQAGHRGEISSALFYSIKGKVKARRTSPASAPAAAVTPSRSEFIRAFLLQHPKASFSEIQRAYQEGGYTDALTIGLYYNIKSALKKQGAHRRPAAATAKAASAPATEYLSIEASLDQLIQQAEALKDRGLAEDLRHARRRAAVALIRA